MKTFLKVLGIAVLVVVALIAAAFSWLSLKKPAQRMAAAEKIEPTPERVARGKYIVEHVSVCLDCHSDHLLTYSMPVKPGTEGLGGYIFDKKIGFPGVVAAQNITQDPVDGLGKWSDGEIMRAMREGVDRNGNALFPMMPYQLLRDMSDDDAKAVIVYLRTLKPLPNHVPEKKLDFPVNFIVKFIPKPLSGPVPPPDRTNSVAYGKYLATIGGCYECHTPHDAHNALIASQAYTGGWEMAGPWGRNFTANLTPDPDNYMGRA
ncbi:MAG TPA: cytochrome C, partial [Thermoanaerobaculia bacterium]|nr:cytochrome C [Thermoanaerobaculia bacterium]